MKTARIALVWLTLVAALPGAACAWGQTGHRVVGEIAQHHLSTTAARAVAEILGADSLARVSTWADEIRAEAAWRKADDWHWVTIADGQSYAGSPKNPHGDVIEAIGRFRAVLRDRAAPAAERRQALAFLVHFVGDVHQPLHVGRGDDHGGNSILVLWFGEPSNLHSVWDSGILDKLQLSYTELAAFLDHPTSEEVARWQSDDLLQWAAESQALRPVVYDLGDRRLSYGYLHAAQPVVEQRLLQAGIRLAGILDADLGGASGGAAPLP